jgi:hypothetical protein
MEVLPTRSWELWYINLGFPGHPLGVQPSSSPEGWWAAPPLCASVSPQDFLMGAPGVMWAEGSGLQQALTIPIPCVPRPLVGHGDRGWQASPGPCMALPGVPAAARWPLLRRDSDLQELRPVSSALRKRQVSGEGPSPLPNLSVQSAMGLLGTCLEPGATNLWVGPPGSAQVRPARGVSLRPTPRTILTPLPLETSGWCQWCLALIT